MPPAKRLRAIEKAKIDALSQQNSSGQAIADAIKRSKSYLNGYLACKNKPRLGVKVGRPKLLIPRSQKALVNVARKVRMTARKVSAKVLINVSLRTVQRNLSSHADIEFGHIQVRPKLDGSGGVMIWAGISWKLRLI